VEADDHVQPNRRPVGNGREIRVRGGRVHVFDVVRVQQPHAAPRYPHVSPGVSGKAYRGCVTQRWQSRPAGWARGIAPNGDRRYVSPTGRWPTAASAVSAWLSGRGSMKRSAMRRGVRALVLVGSIVGMITAGIATQASASLPPLPSVIGIGTNNSSAN